MAFICSILEDDWLDKTAVKIRDKIGLDLTSHDQNVDWIKGQINHVGANFDVSGNCIIVYGMSIT